MAQDDIKADAAHRRIARALLCIVLGIVIGIGASRRMVVPARIISNSMAPTVVSGDLAIVTPALNSHESPRLGDIVLFRFPFGSSSTAIKRVVAREGDRVTEDDGHLVINGSRLPWSAVEEETARRLEARLGARHEGATFFEEKVGAEMVSIMVLREKRGTGRKQDIKSRRDILVPHGCVFVVGDNRDMSADSRTFGCVPREEILGIVRIVIPALNAEVRGARPRDALRRAGTESAYARDSHRRSFPARTLGLSLNLI